MAAWADVATAKAKATLINLIIVSSHGDPFKDRFPEGFAGYGTSTYHGISGIRNMSSSLAGYILATSGEDTFAEHTLGSFVATVGALPSRYHDNAVWVVHPVGLDDAAPHDRCGMVRDGPLFSDGDRDLPTRRKTEASRSAPLRERDAPWPRRTQFQSTNWFD
jgi:hypothetical protein